MLLMLLFICSDGCGRSGTICAIMFCIERLKLEGVVDVFQTVRLMRTQRPHAIRDAVSFHANILLGIVNTKCSPPRGISLPKTSYTFGKKSFCFQEKSIKNPFKSFCSEKISYAFSDECRAPRSPP